jgi:hypothetical protein
LKTGKGDLQAHVRISGLQLTELQEHTGAMCEAFGLDRKIERYKDTKPISLYRWDLECILDVLDWVLNDGRQYPDNRCPECIALNDLRASLLYLYQQTYHVQQAPNR